MKYILVAFMLSTSFCFGQEFEKKSGGVIYSDTTMNQLRHIVDSLNLKFKVCDLNRTYYSKYQAKAHYIYLNTGDIDQALKDIKNNVTFEAFVKKYPETQTNKDLVVVKFKHKNYDGEEELQFCSIPFGGDDDYEFSIIDSGGLYLKKMKNKWFVDNLEEDGFVDEIEGFFFTSEFKKQALPKNYERFLQYSDCMIDTTVRILTKERHNHYWGYEDEEPTRVDNFLAYVHKEINKPDYKDNPESRRKYWEWDSLRLELIDSILSNKESFRKELKGTIDDALKNGGSDEEFEEYVGKYFSRNTELELKRSRKVMGGCSRDNGPRVHAMNIALLAAETHNLEIFLRAHLDIMNDRFERMTDGSYAWGERKTYIKELEELDLDVMSLLLGITLRIENPIKNHYYGNVSRLGRAFAETKYSKKIEERMLSMIKDNSLDDYNRILIYYLFLNYNHHIKDEAQQKQNKEKLEVAVKELPEYLSKRLNAQEK